MSEVLCVVKGDEKTLTQWVGAKPDRYVVWVGTDTKSHPRIIAADDNELMFQQIASELVYLPFVYDDPVHPALQRLARIQTEIQYRASDFKDQGMKLLENFRSNLQKPTSLSQACFGKFGDYTALVCGAGPSLQEIIPFLKQHSGAFLILGCGAGMQALIAAGIKPHLAVHVDPDPYHKFPKTDVPLFYQLRTSHEVVSQMKGPRFLMAGSGEFFLERYIEEKLGLGAASDGGWTAVTRGAVLAADLGCKQIYFAGVDFSGAVYAKGVQSPQEDEMVKIALNDGTHVQTRPDWLLAAEWLNSWVQDHPTITCGICSKKNPLMPDIPLVKIEECVGKESSFKIEAREVFGKEVWDEIAQSFAKCRSLVDQFMQHFQTIFPQPPLGDATCVKILEEIDRQLAVESILNPIWAYWEVVIKRHPESHPDALIIHRVLLLKSLADRFYA